MNFKNIVREATAALQRNWVRSVLTILGIAVGVGAFICVVAIGNAGSSIENQLQSFANVSALSLGGKELGLLLSPELKGGKDRIGGDYHDCDEPVTFEHLHPRSVRPRRIALNY